MAFLNSLSNTTKVKWKDKTSYPQTFKIKSVNDLILLGWNYTGDSFNFTRLWRIIPALIELNNMVGMEELKKKIINFVLFVIQDFHLTDEGSSPLMHTVLSGPPGCGKTQVAHIIAKIYCGLGFLPSDKVTVLKITDLKGDVIGRSEALTVQMFERAKGGVLFFDEAYSLGHEKTDSFSKVIIDIITQQLLLCHKKLIFMIAGYEEELKKYFFSQNPGLDRRFPNRCRFRIDGYTPEELKMIFLKMIKKDGWMLEENVLSKCNFFNKENFPNYGGDIENFVEDCKIVHSQRILGSTSGKRILSYEDIESAVELSTYRKKEEMPEWVKSLYY